MLFVAVGGALGALLRYGMSALLALLGVNNFFTLLFANGLGALLAGLLVGSSLLSERAQLFALVGLLGAFTTFSAYSVALLRHALSGRWGVLVLEILAQNLLALVFVMLGYRLARLVF